MKKILKFGWLLAFSVLLFTGCDALAGNDINVTTQSIVTGKNNTGRWEVSLITMERDGTVVESISYTQEDIPKKKAYGFMISKGNNEAWVCTISASNKESKNYYTGEYSIKYLDGAINLENAEIDRDSEKGTYTLSINGAVYEVDVTSLAESEPENISITLNIADSTDVDTIPVNQEFLDAVKKYLLK